MKKFLIIIIIILLVLMLFGLNTKPETKETALYGVSLTEHNDFGSGRAILYTSTRQSSENDDLPVKYIERNRIYDSMDIILFNFQKGKKIFIYVDGKLSGKVPSDRLETTVTLRRSEGTTKPGIHSVVVKQFKNDDYKKGKMVEFHAINFEVRELNIVL